MLTRRRFLALTALGASACRTSSTLGGEPVDADVLVVGAGLAGLAASHALLAAGRSVVLLEARERVGGRVHTLREPFEHGQFAEAGATFVPASHALTRRTLERFGVGLVEVYSRPVTSGLFLRGTMIRAGAFQEPPVALRADERGAGRRGLFARYVIPGLRELGDLAAADPRRPELARLDGRSFAELLRERGASPAAIELLELGFLGLQGDGFETVSALQVLRELSGPGGPAGTQRIAGGSSRLPEAMAAALGAGLRLGAEVLALDARGEGVRVHLRQGGDRRTLRGRRVLLTLPPTVLRGIELPPGLSTAKRRALAEVGMTSVTRTWLQARSRFWGDLGDVDTDLPLQQLLDATGAQPGEGGILESYATGANARALAALDEPARLERVRGLVEGVFPGASAVLGRARSWSWDEEPFSRGGYAWFRPGGLAAHLAALRAPEGRLHFAGDSTTGYAGWMQGALESGERAAAEILAARS